MLAPATRVYLCGRVMLERHGRVLTEAALAGRQGRLLFAFVGTRRTQPVSKPQLIEAIWGAHTPPSADKALNALVSKLRRAIRRIGVASPYGIVTELGNYQFAMESTWIDVEEARTMLDRAEGALRAGRIGDAWVGANVAAAIARQPFLPDERHAWIETQRVRLQGIGRRALVILSTASAQNGEHALAIQHAADAWSAEPFDEVACQTLMRAHAAAGNRAEALRVYATCRKLFREELGAEPSEQTSAVFLNILRSS